MSRDFRLPVFFMNQFLPSPWVYHIWPFQFFSKIRSSRCTTGVGGKWKKSSVIKVLIILFGHLWEEELTYWYIFAFKFTLRCLQPDIVTIFATGVIDPGGKKSSDTVPLNHTYGKKITMVAYLRVDLRHNTTVLSCTRMSVLGPNYPIAIALKLCL